MRQAIAQLSSISPYSQSQHVAEKRGSREDGREFEERIWRTRMHVDAKGNVIIPPMAIKNALSEAAKFLSLSVPGKGKATYTKHFDAGIMVPAPIEIGQKAADIRGEWLFLPSDGKRGGGKRVDKCYPRIDSWNGMVEILVLDDIITEDVLKLHLKAAGSFIGIGRWRPRNGGMYGRFEISDWAWQAYNIGEAA